MTFQEFLNKVDNTFHGYSYKDQIRYGQTIMNVLHDVWPEKYNEITGTEFDCFYTNSLVKLTLDKLEKEWYNIQ